MAEKETLRVEAELDTSKLLKNAKTAESQLDNTMKKAEQSANRASRAIDKVSDSIKKMSENSKKVNSNLNPASLAPAAINNDEYAKNLKKSKENTDALTASNLAMANSVKTSTAEIKNQSQQLKSSAEAAYRYSADYVKLKRAVREAKESAIARGVNPNDDLAYTESRKALDKFIASHKNLTDAKRKDVAATNAQANAQSNFNKQLEQTQRSLKWIGGAMAANQAFGSLYDFTKAAFGKKENEWGAGNIGRDMITSGLGAAMSGGIAAGMMGGSAGTVGIAAAAMALVTAGTTLMQAGQKMLEASEAQKAMIDRQQSANAKNVRTRDEQEARDKEWNAFEKSVNDLMKKGDVEGAQALIKDMQAKQQAAFDKADAATRKSSIQADAGLVTGNFGESYKSWQDYENARKEAKSKLDALTKLNESIYNSEVQRNLQIKAEVDARSKIIDDIRAEDALKNQLVLIEKNILKGNVDYNDEIEKYSRMVEEAKVNMEKNVGNEKAFEAYQKDLSDATEMLTAAQNARAEYLRRQQAQERERWANSIRDQEEQLSRFTGMMNNPISDQWSRIGASTYAYQGVNESINTKIGKIVTILQKQLENSKKMLEKTNSTDLGWAE